MSQKKEATITDKYLALQKQRQRVIVQSFTFFLLLGYAGSVLSQFTNPNYSTKELILNLIYITFLTIGPLLAIRITAKIVQSIFLLDAVFLGINIMFYGMFYVLSPRLKIFVALAYLPCITVMTIIIMKRRWLFILTVVHLLAVIYHMLVYPELVLELHLAAYIMILTNWIQTVIVSVRMIKLFNDYQQDISDDYEETIQKNVELRALNEEYYATQEELHDQYDQILSLHQESELANEWRKSIIAVTEDVIYGYTVDQNKYTAIENQKPFLGLDFQDEQIDIINSLCDILTDSDAKKLRQKWEMLVSGSLESTIEAIDLKESYQGIKHLNITAFSYVSEVNQQREVVFALKDITDSKNKADKIYRQAYFDDLTNLHNRNGFKQELEKIINEQKRYYVMYIDLERFKDVNSVYGYQIGDVILKRFANAIMKLPLSVVISARIDSDVFAVVISGDIALDNLVDVLGQLKMEMIFGESTVVTKFRVGIIDQLYEGFSADEMMQSADIALIKAKEQTNQFYYIYGNNLNDEIERRVRMTLALEMAIRDEIVRVNYQPIVDTNTGDLRGFEALARWKDSRLGHVSPFEFVTLAEKTSLIDILGNCIVNQVCTFSKEVNALDQSYRISINISGKQLLNPNFAVEFEQMISKHHVRPENIGLEVTETGLIDSLDLAVKHLTYLQKLGFKIYLDDFGTGYSSLNYLDQLPIDVLKIDRSFIMEIETNVKKYKLLKTMVVLAKELNIMTVAEGVETKSQLNLVKGLAIDMVQGYYYSKPLEVEDTLNFIRDNKRG